MTTVYVVQHVHSLPDQGEDVKFLGVYTSREKALAAIRRLSRQPGFSEGPTGFSTDEYQLDKDYWTEGFVTDSAARREPSAKKRRSRPRPLAG